MLSLSKFINVPVFIISLLIGLFIIYYSMNGEIRKIYIYPTPDNIHLLQYKDNANMCFEFKEHEITCPIDDAKISRYTPQ